MAWLSTNSGTGATTWQGARTSALFTTRHGGVSTGPYSSLNLGGHVGDDATHVATNRERVRSWIDPAGSTLLFMDQVHGDRVVVAEEPWTHPPTADALVTATPGLYLAVMVADCVPIVLVDDDAGIAGVAHAGRMGLHLGIAGTTVEMMHRLGATRVHATLGPSICARCYEVPEQLRADVAERVPVAASISRTGTPALDLAAGVAQQLRDAGAEVTILPGCTAQDDRFFSYRRDGVTGRFAGIAGVR